MSAPDTAPLQTRRRPGPPLSSPRSSLNLAWSEARAQTQSEVVVCACRNRSYNGWLNNIYHKIHPTVVAVSKHVGHDRFHYRGPCFSNEPSICKYKRRFVLFSLLLLTSLIPQDLKTRTSQSPPQDLVTRYGTCSCSFPHPQR